MKPMRVLLADDHALVRAGLRSLLEAEPDVEVVGEAADGDAVLVQAARLAPDLVLLDLSMPAGGGLTAMTALRARMPAVRVLILSMHANPEYVREALAAGASGYLLKDAAPVELALALKAVARGDSYLSPSISAQVVAGFLQATGESQPLTARQREVLQRLAQGQAAKQIAFDLGLSVKTIEAHRAQIMERLGIRDLAGLVRYAVREGLVRLE